jgi:signal transduction histidine kinase/CheY-like chemotaxis protein
MRPTSHPLLLGFALVCLAALRAEDSPAATRVGGLPPVRVFTVRDTGATTMAWSAAQDRRGAMYFGCDTLLSFDGDRWRSDAVASSYMIRGLDVGPNGRIWVGGMNEIGWFEAAATGPLSYHSLAGELPAAEGAIGEVWSVYALGNEQAVFIAKDRILRWDGRRLVSWSVPGADMVWSTRANSGIYVDEPRRGLMKMGADGPLVALPSSLVGTTPIRWLADSGPDKLLLGSDGLRTLHAGACRPLESEASAFVRANTLTSAVNLEGDLLAVGTIKGGIAIIDRAGHLRHVYDHRSGLPSDQVYSLFADRQGSLWAMGPTSITRLALHSDVSVFGPEAGYPENGVEALAESSGSLYAASHTDLFRLIDGPHPSRAGRFAPLGISSDRFYGLVSLPEGVLVGHLRGLGVLGPDGLRNVGGSNEPVFRLAPSESAPGTVLASHSDSVDAVEVGSGRTTRLAESLPDYADTVAEEGGGPLWIGTQSKGLFVVRPGSTRAAPAGQGSGGLPPSGPAMVGRVGPSVVVLTRQGAFYLDPAERVFHPISGVPLGTPAALSNADGQGSIWATLEPEAGGRLPFLGRLSWTVSGATWTPQAVEGLAALGSPLSLRVDRSAEGDTLWIAGTAALLRLGPRALQGNRPPPRPVIRAWIEKGAGGRAVPLAGALAYANQRLHAEFSSFDFGLKASEHYQSMLVGAENEWSAPTDSAERDVSGLREGTYDLVVRLRADSGEVSAPAVFHFEVAPPWWRTRLAYGALALTGTAALLAFSRFRQRTLRRRALLLESRVRERTDELERANAAKSRFVASVSHEIRNPIGGILGSTLALSRTPLDTEQREMVSTLGNCASFLASLVEDILDLAAIEAGALRTVAAPMEPRHLLESVVAMLKPRAAGAHLEAAVAGEVPESIVCDGARVQQVIVNFALNSLKFGGQNIRLSVDVRGGCVEFSVADDGPGIPGEEQKQLFIPFSRLESARSSAIQGSGLGLAVSRMLAEKMGGAVGLESTVGLGSRFFISLPLVVGRPVNALPQPLSVRGARALVVEDIDYVAGAMGWMLEGLGFKVDFAADGEQALERLASVSYDAVFLDFDIPKISGLEVARRFRASETEGRRTLLIATTALSTAGDRDACLAAGMDAFLAKPVTPEKLSAVLVSTRDGRFTMEPIDYSETPSLWNEEPDLEMLRRLTDGSPAGLAREVDRYFASLDEALAGLTSARTADVGATLASAAHRLLSLARIVGAGSLAAAAADLQEFAAVYTRREIDEQTALVRREADALRRMLDRQRLAAPASP